MKVLFVSNDPLVFSADSDVRARMREYAAAIGELHILSRAPLGTHAVQEGPLCLHPIALPRLVSFFFLARRIRPLIEEFGIEVVSAQDPFEYGLAAAKAVAGTKAKLHLQVHTDFLSPWFVRSGNWRAVKMRVPRANFVRRALADQCLPQAAGIRVVSERIKDSLRQRYGNRIPEPTVIPIAVDQAVPAPVPLPPHEFTFALLAAGRLEPEKRLEDILYAIARMGPRYPSVGLVLVGEGRERPRLEALARRLGLTERVVFAGWRSSEETRGMMASAQAFIQASAYEGYGRTLVEAALAGVPIITTDVGIVGEVFRGYTDVLSTPVAHPQNLAVHIANLVDDHQLRRTLADNAREAAARHLAAFTDLPSIIAKDLETAYNFAS